MQAKSTVFPLVQFMFQVACTSLNDCFLEVNCCAKSVSEQTIRDKASRKHGYGHCWRRFCGSKYRFRGGIPCITNIPPQFI